jgi:hypothetical protein
MSYIVPRPGRTIPKKGPKMADSAGYDAAQFEWETVHEEAADQIVFDKVGDTYVGEYLGSEVISFTDRDGEDQSFTQLKFRDNEGLKGINAGYELRKAFDGIPAGSIVRVQYVKNVPITGQASPMKSFRVDTAKSRANQKA